MPDRKSPKQDPNYIPLRHRPASFRPVKKTGTELQFIQGDTPYGDAGEERMHAAEVAADRAQTVREEEAKAAYKAQVESTPEFGFTKEDGNWAIKAWDAPDAKPGDTVTVTKKSGDKQMTLGALLREDRRLRIFAIGEEPKTETPAREERTELPVGMYRSGDTVIRVYHGQKSGINLVKRYDEATGEYMYAGSTTGKAWSLCREAVAMTLDEAKAFGRMSGYCGCCGRRLDVPESVEAGIGPVCAARMEG